MTDKTLHELPPACLKLIPDTALPTKPLPIPAAASLPLFTSSPWWLRGPPPLLTTPHLHHAPFALLGCLIPKGSKLTSSRQSSLISPSPLLPQHLYQSEGTASLLLSRPPPGWKLPHGHLCVPISQHHTGHVTNIQGCLASVPGARFQIKNKVERSAILKLYHSPLVPPSSYPGCTRRKSTHPP